MEHCPTPNKNSRLHFPRFWSKEILCDLNPMDFSVWSMLKTKDYCVAHTSVDVLKTSLLREWASIPHETLRSSVGNFRKKN